MRKGVTKLRATAQARVETLDPSPAAPTPPASAAPIKILTSCPSCLQGLGRYQEDVGVEADYIVVEVAKHILGANWMPEYVERANAGGIERVLV